MIGTLRAKWISPGDFGSSSILPLSEPFQDEVDGAILDARPLQQGLERNTRPYGVANGSRLPEKSFGLGNKQDAAVARAFEHRRHGLRRHSPQFLKPEIDGLDDCPLDL